MDEPLESSWFYTREGEKLGPVSLADLRLAAREGRLNPRLDMVWTKGMDTWLPAGEIDSLFQRREDPLAEAAAAATAGPGAALGRHGEPREIQLDQNSGWPGSGRAIYILVPLLFSFAWAVGLLYGLPFLKPHLGPQAFPWVALLAPWVPAFVALAVAFSRFRNLGMSRWWILGFFVPLLNLWIGYRLFACPPGYPWHKKMDGIGWLLAIFYWVFNLLAIAAAAIAIAVLEGAAGDSELRQKIQDGLRQIQAKQQQLEQNSAPAPTPASPTN